MSPRWKFQIRNGLPFGIFMAIFMTGFDAAMQNSTAPFLTGNFVIKLIIWMLGGVFIVGYFNWREKVKREENKNNPG